MSAALLLTPQLSVVGLSVPLSYLHFLLTFQSLRGNVVTWYDAEGRPKKSIAKKYYLAYPIAITAISYAACTSCFGFLSLPNPAGYWLYSIAAAMALAGQYYAAEISRGKKTRMPKALATAGYVGAIGCIGYIFFLKFA